MIVLVAMNFFLGEFLFQGFWNVGLVGGESVVSLSHKKRSRWNDWQN